MSRALVFLIFCLSAISSQAQITAITYNIRYNTPRDSANAWPKRLPAIKKQLKNSNFDFLGVQEGLHGQLLDLQQALGDTYRWAHPPTKALSMGLPKTPNKRDPPSTTFL
jgi:hypothetical protein